MAEAVEEIAPETEQRAERAAPPRKRTPAAEKLAGMVIEQLREGTAPWVHPVKPGIVGERARSLATGNEFRGVNQLLLSMMQPDADPRWCTIHQANEMGAKVRKGSRGVPIRALVGWETEDGRKLDKKELPSAGARPLFRVYSVFHASQLDGDAIGPHEPQRAGELEWEPSGRAEELLQKSGAEIVHDQANQCFYRQSEDAIHLPPKENFRDAAAYYATALHELGHWTGHESRLNRDMGGGFGSEEYAREELRAELASYMLALELGIGHDPGSHASYIDSWISTLEGNPLEIYRACEDASRIVDHVMGRGLEIAKERAGDEGPALAKGGELEYEGSASGDLLVGVDGETLGLVRLVDDTPTFFRTPEGQARGLPDEASHEGGLSGLKGMLEHQFALANKYRDGEAVAPMVRARQEGRAAAGASEREGKMDELFRLGFREVRGGVDVVVGGNDVVGRLQEIDLVGGAEWTFDPNQRGVKWGFLKALGAGTKEELMKELRDAHSRNMAEREPGRAGERGAYDLPAGSGFGLQFERHDTEPPLLEVLVGGLLVGHAEPKGEAWAFEAAEAGRQMGMPQTAEGGTELQLKSRLQNDFKENALYGRRVDLDVAYQDREKAKGRGAKWDPGQKTWYAVLSHETIHNLSPWLQGAVRVGPSGGGRDAAQRPSRQVEGAKAPDGAERASAGAPGDGRAKGRGGSDGPGAAPGKGRRVDLDVPYGERNEARALGAKWDRGKKTWYAVLEQDEGLGGLKRWERDRAPAARPSPVEEFRALCESAGLMLEGDPVMDGEIHRVPVRGGKSGAVDGAYLAHMDGRPAGYVQNWREGEKVPWQYSGEGHALKRHAADREEVRERAEVRRREREAQQLEKAREVRAYLETLDNAGIDHPYLKSHGATIEPDAYDPAGNPYGAKVDEKGNLVIPLRDPQGAVWSLQRIGPEGWKQFEKGGATGGHYHVVGDEGQLGEGPLLLTSGFGTGAAVAAATGRPVVCALTDGNMPKVMAKLRPHLRGGVVILADDDRHNEVNSGRECAEKALEAAGLGRVAFPNWTAEERASKDFSDFADVARSRGLAAVRRQVQCELEKVRALERENPQKVREAQRALNPPARLPKGKAPLGLGQ